LQKPAGKFILLLLLAFAVTASAQTSSDETTKIYDLINQVKAAVDDGNFEKAQIVERDLSLKLIQQASKKRQVATPSQKYADLKAALSDDAYKRYLALPRVAMAAFDAGDPAAAEGYARELLADITRFPNFGTGDATFYGNLVLGKVALTRDHDATAAKTWLLAAGKTVGTPALDTFGPNMSLAKDLLAAGERDIVLQFFEECRSFWKNGGDKLTQWIDDVQKGRTPAFGPNLVYGS
jgi:hypothetical protein